MQYLVTFVLLLVPGALAAALHRRLKDLPKGWMLALYAAYTLLIDGVLCGFKLLRGAPVPDILWWFSPPLSFTFYFAVACAMALVLPLLYISLSERRLAVRLTAKQQKTESKSLLAWNGRKALRFLLRFAAVLVVGILIGGLLVTAVYLLPMDNIQDNVRKSAATIESEGTYPFLYSNWRSTRLDNFTDSIMLLMAAYEGDQGVVGDAMLSTYTRFVDNDPADGLVKWATGATDGIETHSYSRYWHGYLVWLKPLLEFFDYQQIRVINTVLQILLTLGVLLVLFRKNGKRLILPLLITIGFLTPNALVQSFQYSWVFYVFMVSTLVLLLRYERLKNKQDFWLLFLLTGMATSYVDFLTYPLITLGVPLAVYLVLRGHDTLRRGITDVVALSVVWGIGYVGMWAGKWALCSLLTDSNVLVSVQGNIFARMSHVYLEETFGWVDIVKRNIEAYNHWVYLGPFLLCLFGYAWLFGCERVRIVQGKLTVDAQWVSGLVLPLLLVAMIPFTWYFIAANHTYIHYWFAHRTLAVSVLAVPAMFARRPETDSR